jgi:hypothetical protein
MQIQKQSLHAEGLYYTGAYYVIVCTCCINYIQKYIPKYLDVSKTISFAYIYLCR